jgi:hypothetical protein
LLQIDGDFEKEMKLKICEHGRNPIPFLVLRFRIVTILNESTSYDCPAPDQRHGPGLEH